MQTYAQGTGPFAVRPTGQPLKVGARGKVVLEIDSDLAVLWLMPRLDQAHLDEMEIDIELRSFSAPPRTIAPDTDLALTWGAMDVPGYSREPFLHFRSFPVCAPDQSTSVRQNGIVTHRLLHDRGLSGWDEVLQHAGMSLASATSYLIFHRTYLCLDAAARGLGVAIGDDVTAGAMLKDGRLVCPCTSVLRGRKAFYLSTGNRAPLRPPVMAFRNWLLEQADSHMHWANDQDFGQG